MSLYVQLVGVPTADTPGTSIFLHHDKRSYIFGRAFEGTQRMYNSRKVRFQHAEHLFLSGSVGWRQMGGLPGALLTITGSLNSASDEAELERHRSEQERGVAIHGGDNISHVLASLRAVVWRQAMTLTLHEQQPTDDSRAADPTNTEPDWQDDSIRVWKLPSRRARSSTPPKRRCVDTPDENGTQENTVEDEIKEGEGLTVTSDIARLIVEKWMFGGVNDQQPLMLYPQKLRDVGSSDTVLCRKNGQLSLYKGPFLEDGVTLNDPDQTVWTPRKGAPKEGEASINLQQHKLSNVSYSDLSMSYIVKAHDRRGKINGALAKSLGVTGPATGKLAQGQSVTVADGRVITPDMVTGEPVAGNGFAVADIESHEFLDSFLDRPEWQNESLMKGVTIMYWILGPGLAQERRIQDFVRAHAGIKHIFCGPETCPDMISHPRAAALQTKLRLVDPERFPVPQFDNTVQLTAPPQDSATEFGRAGMKAHLMPRLNVIADAIAPFPDLLEAAKDVPEEVHELARKAKEASADPDFIARAAAEDEDIPNKDAEVIALGTGSSSPSLYRNVSSTLVRVPGIGTYILDCGEGTLGQIQRLYGAEETKTILRDLRCIAISHLHADHHLGLISLVKAWYEQSLQEGTKNQLAISCIGRHRRMIDELSEVEDIGLHRLNFLSCGTFSKEDKEFVSLKDVEGDNFGLASIKRIPVDHCWKAHAVQLELTSGLRIAYSGDCRPSADFARECEGAHLLIHECTFGDDMQDHARFKKHSTIGEALGVARDMKARKLLLTHFSQRYAKSDAIQSATVDAEPGTGPAVLRAFDMMKVKLSEFRQAACYLPAIEKLMEDQ